MSLSVDTKALRELAEWEKVRPASARTMHEAADELDRLRAEVQFYKGREASFAKALAVSDGGQYRADWPAAIDAAIKERDRLRAENERLKATVAARDAAIESCSKVCEDLATQVHQLEKERS